MATKSTAPSKKFTSYDDIWLERIVRALGKETHPKSLDAVWVFVDKLPLGLNDPALTAIWTSDAVILDGAHRHLLLAERGWSLEACAEAWHRQSPDRQASWFSSRDNAVEHLTLKVLRTLALDVHDPDTSGSFLNLVRRWDEVHASWIGPKGRSRAHLSPGWWRRLWHHAVRTFEPLRPESSRTHGAQWLPAKVLRSAPSGSLPMVSSYHDLQSIPHASSSAWVAWLERFDRALNQRYDALRLAALTRCAEDNRIRALYQQGRYDLIREIRPLLTYQSHAWLFRKGYDYGWVINPEVDPRSFPFRLEERHHDSPLPATLPLAQAWFLGWADQRTSFFQTPPDHFSVFNYNQQGLITLLNVLGPEQALETLPLRDRQTDEPVLIALARRGHWDAVLLLDAAGADLTVRDAHGCTIWSYLLASSLYFNRTGQMDLPSAWTSIQPPNLKELHLPPPTRRWTFQNLWSRALSEMHGTDPLPGTVEKHPSSSRTVAEGLLDAALIGWYSPSERREAERHVLRWQADEKAATQAWAPSNPRPRL